MYMLFLVCGCVLCLVFLFFFFFNDTATTEIYTSFPTRRSSDLQVEHDHQIGLGPHLGASLLKRRFGRSEEHTSELLSRQYLVCRLLLEKKKKNVFGIYDTKKKKKYQKTKQPNL